MNPFPCCLMGCFQEFGKTREDYYYMSHAVALHPLYLHPLVVHLPQISLLLLDTVPWKLLLLQALNNSSFNCLYPQTTLCNTALDNPTQRNKTQLIRAAVKFLETDTVWYEMGTQLDFGKRAGESEGKHLLSPSHGTALICAGFCPRV